MDLAYPRAANAKNIPTINNFAGNHLGGDLHSIYGTRTSRTRERIFYGWLTGRLDRETVDPYLFPHTGPSVTVTTDAQEKAVLRSGSIFGFSSMSARMSQEFINVTNNRVLRFATRTASVPRRRRTRQRTCMKARRSWLRSSHQRLRLPTRFLRRLQIPRRIASSFMPRRCRLVVLAALLRRKRS